MIKTKYMFSEAKAKDTPSKAKDLAPKAKDLAPKANDTTSCPRGASRPTPSLRAAQM